MYRHPSKQQEIILIHHVWSVALFHLGKHKLKKELNTMLCSFSTEIGNDFLRLCAHPRFLPSLI